MKMLHPKCEEKEPIRPISVITKNWLALLGQGWRLRRFDRTGACTRPIASRRRRLYRRDWGTPEDKDTCILGLPPPGPDQTSLFRYL